jgi:LDH2 family malate/lactate/ureidoglycolate dehydrogenase
VIDFNHDDVTVTNTGQAIVAIDPDAFGELDAFKARVDKLVRELRASERMPGVARIWMPGEQSHARRIVNEREGLALPAALRTQLDAFARDIGIPLLQDI